MKDLIQSLCSEHEDLRQSLRSLSAIAERVHCGAAFPSADFAALLTYLREFVFGVHVAKESRTLLTGVAAHGSDAEVESAGQAMRAQADALDLLHCLVLLWEPNGDLCDAERDSLLATSQALSRTLHRCMQLEEQHVFAAGNRIPGDDRMEWPRIVAEIAAGARSAASWRPELAAIAARWN